jgi:DNA-binding response OmpR family regulator
MPRVLVVEDERKVLRSLERGLQAKGYEVVTAQNGEEALSKALSEPLDCVVLDWMLPGRSGIEVLNELRKAGKKLPVLMLTARDAVEDRISGLDSGADDYLVKPFAFAELLARLRVMLRREREERETLLQAGDLRVDLVDRRITRGETELNLTAREFELLTYLLRHKNQVVTRDMLGREVWKEPFYELTNVIEVFMATLRRKIEPLGQKALIHTIRGVGYSLRE